MRLNGVGEDYIRLFIIPLSDDEVGERSLSGFLSFSLKVEGFRLGLTSRLQTLHLLLQRHAMRCNLADPALGGFDE